MPPSVRSLIPTLIACASVTLLLCQRHAGFMLIALALPLTPWLMHSAWVIATKPNARRQQLAKVSVWVVGVSFVLGSHAIMFAAAKKKAELISSALEAYINKFGQCPRELEAIGFTEAMLRDEFGYAAYFCESGKPTFFYGSTFVPFDTENYDFSTHTWRHVYD